jgi:hypothetical protein
MLHVFRKLFGLKRWTGKKRQPPVSKRWQRSLQVEELAARALPSASPVTLVSSGHLLIHGTAGNDRVSVSTDTRNHSKLDVVYDGTTYTFKETRVKEIDFNGGRGNDYFINNTSIRTVANGGAGNDTLIGGSGDDILNGGTGNDTLIGRGGNDSLDGGIGNDNIQGGAGNDHLHGGLGNDVLNGGSGNDQVSGDGGDDQESNGEEMNSDNTLEAHLTNGSGATGTAEFNATTGDFELQIEGAAANTTLDVSIDGNSVGSISTDANGNGQLELSNVTFTVMNQSTITVGDPNNGGLTGTFGSSSTASTELSVQLTSSTSNAHGEAEFSSGDQMLKVEIEGAAPNTTYDVSIDGNKVGTITTDSEGEGEVQLSTAGVTVQQGSTLTIGDLNNPLLSGPFSSNSGQNDD